MQGALQIHYEISSNALLLMNCVLAFYYYSTHGLNLGVSVIPMVVMFWISFFSPKEILYLFI
jgi:hypothetical protein